MNPLVALRQAEQSPWYDDLRRSLITSGDLKTMIDHDGLMGVTSNPSIFEKAITGSADYDQELKRVSAGMIGVKQIYESLAIRDIQNVADLLKRVYQETKGRDGYVSLEVSPDLAFKTEETIEEARHLWREVNRDNVMIKVPGTEEGLPAIERLVGQGMNINVTLLFSVDVYEQVACAYIRGLEKFGANGGDLSRVASVASFFVSRIDVMVDRQLDAALKEQPATRNRALVEGLKGRVAIANAKMAYLKYQEIFESQHFQAMTPHGARPQRLLWASTGTKNPQYPDTYYVDQLIGPATVNTMPASTFEAFRDHGTVATTLTEGVEEAQAVMKRAAECGIDMTAVTDRLRQDGVRMFAASYDQLMGAISRKRLKMLGSEINPQTCAAGSCNAVIDSALKELDEKNFVRRLWANDPTLWHQDPVQQAIIRKALGWLSVSERQIGQVSRLQTFADDIRDAGFQHILLLGMGGSSLCPDVCRMTFGVLHGRPALHVLDSTVPSQVKSFEARVDLERTLCVVASKSGSTTEPLVFQKYFFERMRQVKGDRAGENFIAITDPGSLLEQMARELRFRKIFSGVPELGGRYSALSNFGIVPAALMGVNVGSLLSRAERMRFSCDASVPATDNPGVVLGATLGALAKAGRNKVTLISSPAVGALGGWCEQLIAESTGKEGRGIIPVDDEPLGAPHVYGTDRVFVYIRYADGVEPEQDVAVDALQAAGHPVVRIDVTDVINLGQEFFRWEIAVATAGSLLGINAFDQPNVQESKDFTRAYLEAFQKNGTLPEEAPMMTDGGIRIFADSANQQALQGASSLAQVLVAHLSRVQSGDYVAINAYVERTPAIHECLQRIRTVVRDAKQVATTLGYGPRFLHSTGQLHKGGPNTGVFIQVTADVEQDLVVPGEPYSFGVLVAAQALGDMESLSTRHRRVIRIHLGCGVEDGVRCIQESVEKALSAKKARWFLRPFLQKWKQQSLSGV